VAAPRVSVILPATGDERLLGAALESFAAQALRDFEVVLVGEGDETARAAERFADRAKIVHVRRKAASRAEARNAGVAAATGELVWLAADDHVALPDALEAIAGEHAGEAAIVVGAQSPGDGFFDAVAPLVARFGAALDGLALPWLAALGGWYSLPRAALAEFGGFDERFAGWEGDDLDLPLRWCASGKPIRVTRRAVCARQAHDRDAQPVALADQVETLARKHGALDAWLLWRFLREDDFDAIHQVAVERARGATAAGRELERVADEILRMSLRATRGWFRP